jgi:ParB family chromosome partitioning protein
MSGKKEGIRTSMGRLIERISEESDQPIPQNRDDSRRHGNLLMETLQGHTSEALIVAVEPERVRLWPRHNRLYDLLTEDYCRDLIDSIRAQGQKIPAIARRVPNDPNADYEVIAGARRLWVARYLNVRLQIEVRNLSDEEAFRESDASNKGKDISDFERAREYKLALRDYYAGDRGKMALRLGISAAQLSRYMAIAALNEEIVQAFADPREIGTAYAGKIRAAMKGRAATTRAIERARELKNERQGQVAPKSGSEVVRALVDAANGSRGERSRQASNLVKAKNGAPMLQTRTTKTKHTITVFRDSDAKLEEVIQGVKQAVKNDFAS